MDYTHIKSILVNDKEYQIITLLGKGKGGYSFLARCKGKEFVVKQIHHEPCSYYTFGNKIEAELRDYERLREASILIPRLIEVDKEKEIIVKEYIKGKTIFEMVKNDEAIDKYLPQVKEMAALAKKKNLNIDYFPTNFVVKGDELYYVDYECNEYMDEWSFEVWGKKYWSKSQEFLDYLKENS